MLTKSDSLADHIEVVRMIPEGVFCMFTAWSFYGLTMHVSANYHLAIPKTHKIVLPEYPPVKLYYWTRNTFDLGKTSAEMKGLLVNVYDIERSVCDAIKFRNKIGADLMSEILRNYIHRNDKNLDKLLKYASELRVATTLNQLLQMIL